MSSDVRKCPHCEKVFFDFGTTICPFCHKNIYDVPDSFKNIFGDMFGKDIFNNFNNEE